MTEDPQLLKFADFFVGQHVAVAAPVTARYMGRPSMVTKIEAPLHIMVQFRDGSEARLDCSTYRHIAISVTD